MTDIEQFLEEKLGIPWEPDPIRIAMDVAVDEYRETCEEYDKTVCTGQWNDGTAMPETDEQGRLINHNARESREELLRGIARQFELTREAAEVYWKEAMRIRR